MTNEPTVGGLDEVGYGALAGPYISAVAVFRPSDLAKIPSQVRDSKKMSAGLRKKMYLPLCDIAYDIGIGHAWPWEIDTLTPIMALQLCYCRALNDLSKAPDKLIIDGETPVYGWKGPFILEPKADDKYREVSAASVIAKVFRDEIMKTYAKQFPEYGWDSNMGYGTLDHIEAIEKFGLKIDPAEYLHRRVYCRNALRKIKSRLAPGKAVPEASLLVYDKSGCRLLHKSSRR